jgi:arylsulfatase A-like enzyme
MLKQIIILTSVISSILLLIYYFQGKTTTIHTSTTEDMVVNENQVSDKLPTTNQFLPPYHHQPKIKNTNIITNKNEPLPRPHILMLVFDDLGRTDHTLFESSSVVGYSTPNLERLAKKEGTILTNYYTQTVCSPTRAALMTGRFPHNTGMQHTTTLVPGGTVGLPYDVPTLAEILTALGYQTHAVGKWHLGAASVHQTPTGRGFSTYYGYLQGQVDYWNKTVAGGYDFWDEKATTSASAAYRRPAMAAVGNYSLDLYQIRVEKLIRQYVLTHPTPLSRTTEPFFLYMAYQSIHIPLEAKTLKDKRCDKSKRRVYCCMTMELDDAVGSLYNLLHSVGMWNNTLIIATTDNGGMVSFTRTDYKTPLDPNNPYSLPFPGSLGSNYPLRGSKTTLFEGGVRATAFISGGALHPSERGSTYGELSHSVDLTAFAVKAGRGWEVSSSSSSSSSNVNNKLSPIGNRYNNMDGSPLWGLRLMPEFETENPFGAISTRRGRDIIPINIIHGGQEYSAVRFGRWKLVIGGDVAGADGWYPPQADQPPRMPSNTSRKARHNIWGQKIYLFDLLLDPREENDLAHNYTKAVNEGLAIIKEIVNSPNYREPQTGNRLHIRGMPSPLNGNSWRPFLHDDGISMKDYDEDDHSEERNMVVVVAAVVK